MPTINNRILNRKINIDDFLGKKFKPSIQSVEAFKKLFSSTFPRFSDLIEIKSLDWNKTEFNIKLIEISSKEELNLILKNNFQNKKCDGKFCTNNICTNIHFNLTNKVFLKFLAYFSLKGTSFKITHFLSILCNDLKAKKEYYQIFWKSQRPPFSIIQDWGHNLHKFRFLVLEGIIRNFDQSISLNLPEASIHHSERECQGISPNNKDNGYHFFNFPLGFYDHSFDKYYYLTKEEKQKYILNNNLGNSLSVFTDLSEEDIVMGKGTEKLEKAIDYIIKNINKNNIKVISFNCCCVPRIVGDDIYSILKKTKENINIPFIFSGQLEKTPYEQKIMLLEKYINKIDFENIKKIKNSISLFGYHENKYQKDLGDELLKNGIKINTSFIPSIDIRLLPLMFSSELFIFSPNNFLKEVFEYPFQSIGTKYISPKYPYSIKYTKNWFEIILQEFNLDYKESLENQKLIKIYNNYVAYVKQKEFSVGIILIGKRELEIFLNPDYMNNVDIVYFLEEMGFKINFFVYDDGKGDDGNQEEIINIITQKNKKINISFFSNQEGFENIFKKNKLDLIYSDIYFDDRIINLGLNQFSLKNFFIGYGGAVKTIKGFITLCEMTFYKNYSKYFFK